MKTKNCCFLLFALLLLAPLQATASDEQSTRKPVCTPPPPPTKYIDPHPDETEAITWANETKFAVNGSYRKTIPIEKAVHFHLLVNSDGSIKEAVILKSSGDEAIDQQALTFLKSQQPLPKPRNTLALNTGLRVWFKPKEGVIDVVSEAWLKRTHPDI